MSVCVRSISKSTFPYSLIDSLSLPSGCHVTASYTECFESKGSSDGARELDGILVWQVSVGQYLGVGGMSVVGQLCPIFKVIEPHHFYIYIHIYHFYLYLEILIEGIF